MGGLHARPETSLVQSIKAPDKTWIVKSHNLSQSKSHKAQKPYSEVTKKGNHDSLITSSLPNAADDSIKNKTGYQQDKVTFLHNNHTINKPRTNTKTPGNTSNIINLSTTAPSLTGVKATKTGSHEEIAPTQKRICDMSHKSKVPAP